MAGRGLDFFEPAALDLDQVFLVEPADEGRRAVEAAATPTAAALEQGECNRLALFLVFGQGARWRRQEGRRARQAEDGKRGRGGGAVVEGVPGGEAVVGLRFEQVDGQSTER